MAEQQPTTPQPTSPQQEPARAGTASPEAKAADVNGVPARNAEPEKAQGESTTKEVADRLRVALPTLGDEDKSIVQTVEALLRQSSDPVRANQKNFQHELAYVVQDLEKARGVQIPLSDQARADVTRLAASAPGLENERMRHLMRATTAIEDHGLVRDIRRTASEIGLQADQTAPAISSQIDALENRARLTPRPEVTAESSGPTQGRRTPQTAAPGGRQAQSEHADTAAQGETAHRQDDAVRQNQNRPILVRGAPGGAAMDTIFRALRATGPTNTPPWEPGAQPFGQRLSSFEDKMQQGRDDIAVRGVEKSGRAAVEALEGFRNGEAAVVLNRIREAARTDPGGMAGVLSEMREGGRFADLRQQFNNALSDEKGVTAAYDKAASALARYGQGRIGAEQIIARRPDAANLSAKFEAMDKEIGTAAGEVPSRRDGKNMLEDLSKQIAELLQKAVDSVKNMFSHGPSPSSPSGPSPV